MFRTLLTSGYTLVHLYVFWRAASVPIVSRHFSRKGFLAFAVFLWAGYFLAFSFGHDATGAAARVLELLSMHWLAVLFLCFVSLLATDLATGFGWFVPRLAPPLRGWALAVGGLLSVIALVQGLRAPVVRNYEVHLPGLSAARDGTVLVALSDLHLGSLLGPRWLAGRVAQVRAERPDVVVLLGDLLEGHGQPADELLPVLRQLSAPLGVWAVAGNHESHGDGGSLRLLQQAGFNVLRDRWVEVRPGLVIAGLDDRISRGRPTPEGDPIGSMLTDRPPGTVVLLSHRPPQPDRVVRAGVSLALCGHTHAGQIWPFGYLVRAANPMLGGMYEINGKSIIVCRGTGTWGPRMRLWRPSEMLRVTLRAR